MDGETDRPLRLDRQSSLMPAAPAISNETLTLSGSRLAVTDLQILLAASQLWKLAFRIYGYLDIRISGFLHIRIYGFQEIRIKATSTS